MKVRFKKLVENAIIPSYAKKGDAGMDLTAVGINYDNVEFIEYGTGLAVEIPEGYVGLIFPRSSVSKKSLLQANSVGVIDSGYRGEIKVRFKRVYGDMLLQPAGSEFKHVVQYTEQKFFETGERIAQLIIIPYPEIEVEEALELSNTERGEGGFGHTGK